MKPLFVLFTMSVVFIMVVFHNIEALECILCFSYEGESVEKMPDNWGILGTLDNTSCKSSPDPFYAVPCGLMQVDPAFKFRSCGKVTFSFCNETLWFEMTVRGCMATAAELPDGYCADMMLEELSAFPSVGDDFKELMEEFPPATSVNICSCNSSRCNVTSDSDDDDAFGNACGGSDGSVWVTRSLEKSIIMWIIFAVIFSRSHN